MTTSFVGQSVCAGSMPGAESEGGGTTSGTSVGAASGFGVSSDMANWSGFCDRGVCLVVNWFGFEAFVIMGGMPYKCSSTRRLLFGEISARERHEVS